MGETRAGGVGNGSVLTKTTRKWRDRPVFLDRDVKSQEQSILEIGVCQKQNHRRDFASPWSAISRATCSSVTAEASTVI